MVIDSSAILAILLGEPEAAEFVARLNADPMRLISAVSALEAGMVIHVRKGPLGVAEFENFLAQAQIDIVPFDAAQSRLGRDAFCRFGRGNHPAGLNFGDCASYALALSSGEPLLYKGNDFAQTDVPGVIA